MTSKTGADAARMFDAWAEAGRGDSMAQGHWPMVSQIIEQMALKPGMTCLDVGCGNGYAVRAMASRVAPGGQALGFDVSPGMVEAARNQPDNPPTVCFDEAPAETLPMAGESTDRILAVEMIYYLPDPLAALKEWYRVLKPGGSVWVMADYYRENPYSAAWGDLIEIPMKYRSEREYRGLLEEAGFTAVFSERLYNRNPIAPEEAERFKPGWGYESLDDVKRFRTEIGSLLVSGKKSSPDIDLPL